MKKEMPTKYDHKQVEANRYQKWLSQNLFAANDKNKTPYCIVIPPPNVTGKLHLGHAWDTALQDIVARFKKMQGFDMLWLPGMDHAGIATQAKVEERLKQEGVSRYDLGRERFLERSWAWKDEYASLIKDQWATLGLALDYSRERFTLDQGLSDAVKKVFVDLYHDGLIFQGERIINWDPQAKTALSNIEVIHKEIKGAMYTFSFKVKDSNEVLHVATTRPETMFGDVCVFVHPKDKRYQHLIGKTVINPASKREMPILADEYIDMEFGTGAMKCTPAHDSNDFALSTKYNLERPICINPDGTMNALAQQFVGLDRFECRKALLKQIEAEGNLIEIKEHIHQVGHSERTDVIVEPYLSKQWFVKMKPLAEQVLAMQTKKGEDIKFFPPRFNKTFTTWLENIEDWCISRQLWWGHRIPAWFHNETGEVYVGEEPPENVLDYTQDEDVLDTWFSSALWPFSTLGWPANTEDFNRFFPNDLLITGYDIIFFWVARMAFMAKYNTNQRPFKHVLIHGLVRDAQGRKMSKSLGNGVDPMEVIEQYGADALRFFLTTSTSPGQDLRYIPEKVEAAWNFINKIWNAARFVGLNTPEGFTIDPNYLASTSIIDNWMLEKLNQTIIDVTKNMERYEFGLVGTQLVSFIWDDFCSWYIELSKSALASEDKMVVNTTLSTLHVGLSAILQLIHPFMPFVSEAIYESFYGETALLTTSWPNEIGGVSQSNTTQVDQLINMISIVRENRLLKGIKKDIELFATLVDGDHQVKQLDNEISNMLKKMVNVSLLDTIDAQAQAYPIANGTLYLNFESVEDKQEVISKLLEQQRKLQEEVNRGEAMLANENFIFKAPPAKVALEQEKLAEYKRQLEVVVESLKQKQN